MILASVGARTVSKQAPLGSLHYATPPDKYTQCPAKAHRATPSHTEPHRATEPPPHTRHTEHPQALRAPPAAPSTPHTPSRCEPRPPPLSHRVALPRPSVHTRARSAATERGVLAMRWPLRLVVSGTHAPAWCNHASRSRMASAMEPRSLRMGLADSWAIQTAIVSTVSSLSSTW